MRYRPLLLILLLAVGAGAADAQSAVVKQNVNLRAGPSSGTTLIRTLRPGDELTLLRPDTVTRYVQVRTAAGEEGWVYTPRIRVLAGVGTLAAVGPPEIYRGCALEGNAQHERRQALNRLKNRIVAPASTDIDTAVTLPALLQSGNDVARWRADRGAVITGHVIAVKKGGQETVNCGEAEELYRDTHIEIVAAPDDTAKKRRVVVEVTPRWRHFMGERGADWSTPALAAGLRGKRVRFTGWLFFDEEHDDEAENTTPGRAANWRATAWEVHPVTKIEVVE